MTHMVNAWLGKHQQEFVHLAQQKTLPHAMLITGVQGSGKRELSIWLSQFILCQGNRLASTGPCGQCKSCHLHTQETHPDFKKIELQGASISVDQVRQVSKFLEQKAQLAQAQVVIFEHAEKLTESAANALLKTLEEPTPHSYIILQSQDAQRLLPTIVSRCQTYPIRPPVGHALSSSLQLQDQDPYSNLSHLPELSDSQLMQEFKQLKEQYLTFVSTGIGKMRLIELCQQQEHSLRWLEKATVDGIRAQAGWRQGQHAISASAGDALAGDDSLWKCYLLLKAFNQKSHTLAQFNQSHGIEKLFADMQHLVK